MLLIKLMYFTSISFAERLKRTPVIMTLTYRNYKVYLNWNWDCVIPETRQNHEFLLHKMTTIMPQSGTGYSKQRWLLTICGLFLYLMDICTDTALAVRYFKETHYVWSGMTALFIIGGLMVNQIFSYAWFLDDYRETKDKNEGEQALDCRRKRKVLALHVFGMGIFFRYVHAWMSSTQDLQGANWNSHILFALQRTAYWNVSLSLL